MHVQLEHSCNNGYVYVCYAGVYLSGEPGPGENVPDVVGGIGVQQSLRLEERRSSRVWFSRRMLRMADGAAPRPNV